MNYFFSANQVESIVNYLKKKPHDEADPSIPEILAESAVYFDNDLKDAEDV